MIYVIQDLMCKQQDTITLDTFRRNNHYVSVDKLVPLGSCAVSEIITYKLFTLPVSFAPLVTNPIVFAEPPQSMVSRMVKLTSEII